MRSVRPDPPSRPSRRRPRPTTSGSWPTPGATCRDTVGPAVADDFARQRAVGAAGTLGTIDHQLRFGDDRDARELAGLAALLGHRPRTVAEGLLEIVALADEPGRAQDLVAYLARHLTREAMLSSPLLGDLADRVPQTLEER